MPPSPGALPPLFDRWMRECLGGAVPGEPRSTCDDCAMCAGPLPPGAPPVDDPLFYDPRVKCCSYTPTLWNFLTGALLADRTPGTRAGRATVERRIAAGVAVTPLGLGQPPAYAAVYDSAHAAFGRSHTLRCPHFLEDGGRCGVWRARESTCATYFCKLERGAVGERFWRRLQHLLALAERQVAVWCVRELDPGEGALAALFPPFADPAPPPGAAELDGRVTAERRALLWGRWLGREGEFFERSAGLVEGLAWADVVRLAGPELELSARLARTAFEALVTPAVPVRLTRGPLTLTPQPDGATLVTTYSPLDPLRLSPAVLEILPYFDGRTVRAARQAIRRELGYEVDTALVQRLADFGVLREAGS